MRLTEEETYQAAGLVGRLASVDGHLAIALGHVANLAYDRGHKDGKAEGREDMAREIVAWLKGPEDWVGSGYYHAADVAMGERVARWLESQGVKI